jgi:hypothetical protein
MKFEFCLLINAEIPAPMPCLSKGIPFVLLIGFGRMSNRWKSEKILYNFFVWL